MRFSQTYSRFSSFSNESSVFQPTKRSPSPASFCCKLSAVNSVHLQEKPTNFYLSVDQNYKTEVNYYIMFPNFGTTADTLSKASTIVFRIGTDAHLYDDPEDVNIAPLLDSRFDSEKCEALKRLLALIAQGFDVSNFFPQVPIFTVALISFFALLPMTCKKSINEQKTRKNWFRNCIGAAGIKYNNFN